MQWAAQQMIEAFPFGEMPRYLIRDRDSIYGDYSSGRVENHGNRRSSLRTTITLAKSVLRTNHRFHTPRTLESRDHIGRGSSQAHLSLYFSYYHESRPHYRLIAIHRRHVKSSHRARENSSPFRRSVNCIIATRGLRDRRILPSDPSFAAVSLRATAQIDPFGWCRANRLIRRSALS